ncbi:MAG: sugar ABC transporter permease, partial [Lachnospiraceae bacterium]|nr:sugar ABC transporter permease [Lachnospiraceae bacterium]
MNIVKRVIGTLIIPLIAFILTWGICASRGVMLFENTGNYIAFFRATVSVMLTTFALSINLNSGRFDFSIGSVALLSSIISSTIAINLSLPVWAMLLISIISGMLLGTISGGIYIITKLPPIIVSLGVTLLFEGAAFVLTDGYGVSFV